MRDALLAQELGTAWVVATGTLTNVALLFAVFPELVAHIGGLSIMGGAIGGGFTDAPMGKVDGDGVWRGRVGNWSEWAEFNVYVCLSLLEGVWVAGWGGGEPDCGLRDKGTRRTGC